MLIFRMWHRPVPGVKPSAHDPEKYGDFLCGQVIAAAKMLIW
jgi:hypothetical protein